MSTANRSADPILARVLNAAGVSRPQDLSRAPNRYYVHNFSFTAPAGAQWSAQRKNDVGGLFVVTHLVGVVVYSATVTPVVAGTELARIMDPSPPAGVGNTLAPYGSQLVQFAWNANAWSRDPMYWRDIIGTIDHPHIMLHQPVIPAGADMVWTGTNGSAVAVAGEIAMHGFIVGA